MPPPVTSFDPVAHRYEIGGREVPSVTQIVRAVLGADSFKHPDSEWYMQRGTMVHKAMALMLTGHNIDPATLDPRIAGFIDAGKLAIRQLGIVAEAVEKTMFHQGLRFAGTMDCLSMDGIIYDWKSGNGDKLAQVQLGAYSELCAANKMTPKVRGLCVVTLGEDGRYLTEHFKADQAVRIFRAALTVYGFMQANK